MSCSHNILLYQCFPSRPLPGKMDSLETGRRSPTLISRSCSTYLYTFIQPRVLRRRHVGLKAACRWIAEQVNRKHTVRRGCRRTPLAVAVADCSPPAQAPTNWPNLHLFVPPSYFATQRPTYFFVRKFYQSATIPVQRPPDIPSADH